MTLAATTRYTYTKISLYKNGAYKIKSKEFFDNLKAHKEEFIQRFICPCCKKSFYIKKQNFPHAHIRDEIRRAISVFRVDERISLRTLRDCIHKILYVEICLALFMAS